MKRRLGEMAVVIFFWSAVAMGCRPPTPGTPAGDLIQCGTEAVQRNWPRVLGPANTCLTGGSATACLIGLIDPVAGITEDVIACVVRREGSDFNAAAQANPVDTRSARAASNARKFLGDRGYRFAE